MFKWEEGSVSGYETPCSRSAVHYYFLLLLQIMSTLRANYFTEANVSKCNLLGSVPDTQRSFTGQRFSSFSINGGHMDGDTICMRRGRSFRVPRSDETARSAAEVPIPPLALELSLPRPWVMKTINISNYHPKSALNPLPIDLIDCLSYELLPIEQRTA